MKNNLNIVIVDYGVGNLHSIIKAFQFFGVKVFVSEELSIVDAADAIILPGVGSFMAGMRGLKVRGLVDSVKKSAAANKPMLGICLGAQLMLTKGYEFGEFDGLDIFSGKVIRFPELRDNEKIPQIGWNGVYSPKNSSWNNSILSGLPQDFDAYFVHSYILVPDKKEDILGLTNYGGQEFCSIMKKGNIYASQFHPEKSGKARLEIIRNFINIL